MRMTQGIVFSLTSCPVGERSEHGYNTWSSAARLLQAWRAGATLLGSSSQRRVAALASRWESGRPLPAGDAAPSNCALPTSKQGQPSQLPKDSWTPQASAGCCEPPVLSLHWMPDWRLRGQPLGPPQADADQSQPAKRNCWSDLAAADKPLKRRPILARPAPSPPQGVYGSPKDSWTPQASNRRSGHRACTVRRPYLASLGSALLI